MSLGHVGIVFGREMSRLARSCKDWHQLLELCGLFQVLIADADGVYDPTDPNDRMLLGLRGMMSEAEIHVLRSRLHQGKLNKARRGELFTCVPIGYVRSPDGGIALDPDEQVRSVVVAGVRQVRRTRLADEGRTPTSWPTASGSGCGCTRGRARGDWSGGGPGGARLYEMLRHPIYAGAYAYGRCPFDPTRRVAGKPKSGRRNAPPEEWVCLLRDQVPAYIPWEQFEENRRRLAANDRGPGSKTATGRAPTLLNGIVRCGRCGKPMGARNARASANPRYACDWEFREYGGPRCQSLVAAYPDRLIEVAGAQGGRAGGAGAEPPGRRASRAGPRAAAYATGSSGWSGPSTRRTGRGGSTTRSTRRTGWWPGSWSGSGSRSWPSDERLEEDYDRFRPEQPRHLTASDRERIAALAADLPGAVAQSDDDRRRPAGDRPAADRARGADPRRGVGAGRRGRPLARRGGHAARDPPGPADLSVARWAGTSCGSGSWSCGATG